MSTAFITGATGFLGGHLLQRLCRSGFKVRALVRSTSCYDTLKKLPVEFVTGDLSNVDVIRNAMKGCDHVFHAAADYRLWSRNPAEMYVANVDGTRTIMQAAWDFGVEKIVYTSTVGTIGLNGSSPSDESSFLQFNRYTGHYKKSKFLAEQEALAFAKRGLPVVIVNPSAPVGSHDWKPTPTGRIVQDFLNGRMPMYLETGLNLVDVEDVADGHLLAAQHGRHGERYILGNENLTLKQILDILSEITGIPAPKLRCPYPLALTAAWLSETATWLTGAKEPRVPREGVYMAKRHMFFDPSKAQRELAFHPRPARVALAKAVRWFLENGYVSRLLPRLPASLKSFELNSPPIPSSAMVEDSTAIAVGK